MSRNLISWNQRSRGKFNKISNGIQINCDLRSACTVRKYQFGDCVPDKCAVDFSVAYSNWCVAQTIWWVLECINNTLNTSSLTDSYIVFTLKMESLSKDTGKSLSEAFILISTNPQYDKRLLIDLPVQYMKTTTSEHGENMLWA